MARFRHLSKAPISEALVDFRVQHRIAVDPVMFRVLHDEIGADWKMEDQRYVAAHVDMPPGRPAAATIKDQRLRGILFRSPDGTELAQFRTDGFTYNRLARYTSWADVRPRALGYWTIYDRASRPEVVRRLALRYINRIPLATGKTRLEDLLRLHLEIPDDLPQDLSSLLARVTLHDLATGVAANITQTIQPPVGEGHGALVLDIDAFKVEDFLSDDQDRIIERLEALRDFKNRLFFGSVTDQALQPFE